jgi:hypothetical protein
MRLLPLAALVLFVGCGPGVDPLVGSFKFTMTGMDTNTGSTSTQNSTGAGNLAITANAALTSYLITVAEDGGGSSCVLEGTVDEKVTTDIVVKAEQKCIFIAGATTTTVTFSAGKAVLKQASARAMDTVTLDLTYTYTGVTQFIVTTNFSGSGKRTYTGTRR